jgi:hypothetical protein
VPNERETTSGNGGQWRDDQGCRLASPPVPYHKMIDDDGKWNNVHDKHRQLKNLKQYLLNNLFACHMVNYRCLL